MPRKLSVITMLVRERNRSQGRPVTRLIRLSFGPFQLGGLAADALEEVPAKVLAEQLGTRSGSAPRNRRATSNR